MAVLAHRLALEDLFAELQHTGFFRGGRCLSAGWPYVSREPQEACCGSNQSPAAAYACSALFQNCSDHSNTPDPALANCCFPRVATYRQRSNQSGRIRPDLRVLAQINPPDVSSQPGRRFTAHEVIEGCLG